MYRTSVFILTVLHSIAAFGWRENSVSPKDTIDNWQIYVDGKLLVAANENQKFPNLPKVILSAKNLKSDSKLRIVYRTDTPSRNKVEIQIGDSQKGRLSQHYFSSEKAIILKVSELRDLAARDNEGQELVLYFYNGILSRPGPHVRGRPIVQLKFS